MSFDQSPKYRPLIFGVTRVKLRDGAPGTHTCRPTSRCCPIPSA